MSRKKFYYIYCVEMNDVWLNDNNTYLYRSNEEYNKPLSECNNDFDIYFKNW